MASTIDTGKLQAAIIPNIFAAMRNFPSVMTLKITEINQPNPLTKNTIKPRINHLFLMAFLYLLLHPSKIFSTSTENRCSNYLWKRIGMDLFDGLLNFLIMHLSSLRNA